MNTGTEVENQKIEKKNSKENRTQKKRSPVANTTRKRKLRIVETLPISMSTVPPVATRLNETIVDVLGRLATMMTKKGDYIRSRAYTKAQDTVLSITTDITNVDQLKGKPNIGPTILEKVKEYVSTGTLRLFEREKDNPEYILSEVYGIGPKKAHELVVEKGVRTIADLRARQDELLNETQKMGLHYYEDILEKVPRSEIDVYNAQFGKAFDKSLASHPTQTNSNYEIVGSYRRGATVSGDIDVIVTSNLPDVFVSFVDALISAKIIIEVLSRGKTKCLVIARLPGHKVARRVDFMFTSPEEYPFAVLYFTGSKGFNTVMRGHALKQGLSLNEHGLYKKLPGKEKEEKIDTTFKTERDIFDHLRLVYKHPVDRIDGRAVVPMDPSVSTEIVPVVPLPKAEEPVPKAKRSSKKTDIKTSPHTITIKKRGMKSVAAQSVAAQSVAAQSVAAQSVAAQSANQRIDAFKTNGISVLEKLNEKELSDMVVATNDAYYNTQTPLLTDNEYDILKEYIETKFPKNEAIQQVGAPVTKNKVTLPYHMPSMDKIKPDTNALTTWMTKYKGPYLLSCKLDGVSGMYDCTGKEPKLYTRGDGKVGQNITGLLPHLRLPGAKGFVIRGEFIIPKAVFDAKYKETFANPRNLVSGIINSKTMDSKIGDIHFVVYEIIHPQLKPSEQMKKLTDLGFEVVQHRNDKVLSNASLSETLMDWRSNYKYEIDGVIVSDDNVYPRKEGNPEHAFAFKMVISDQMAEAKVVDVEWAASKSGYLKPRIRIEPIRLGGVTIEYCTAFNGNFVEKNKIGIGAVIQIIRSGDVIPYIQAVTSPASQPKMPTVPYHWNDTHVDIILDDVTTDETVLLKNITAFFVELEVDGLSAGNVKRIMNAGFNSVPKILKMTRADFANVEGFKEKMVTKIYEGIKAKVDSATLLQVMVASNLFGRGIGERKIRPIMEKYPTILTSAETPAQKTTMLLSVPGIGKEQSKLFVENIPRFLAFLRECGLEGKLTPGPVSQVATVPDVPPVPFETVDKTNPLYGKKIVMTKIRDKDIIAYMKTVGATLEDAIKKDTFVLIVKSKSDVSNKTKYAYDNSIPIMEPAEFKERFMS
uniref:DNA polymerase beta n=1 Tax=viral metagenome TaxID=1070528 RepID=A0A6C0DNB5_9ZZZZ